MDFRHLFLSFEGRTRRQNFWIGVIILWLIEGVVYSFLWMPSFAGAAMRGNPFAIASVLSVHSLVGDLVFLALLWPSLALQVKRWHDRDKSGWFVLVNLIPFIGWLWTLIECGFLDGTQGPNRFGPSPKGIQGV